jgi:hypothetical protein
MTYELVLALVPPDTPDPVERACELMDPFFHCETCCHWQEEDYDEDGPAPRQGEHFWDGANVGGHYHEGCLWRGRYGLLPPDHPINSLEDEVRRAGDLDLWFQYLPPTGLVTPDGDIYFTAGEPGAWQSIAQLRAYEDRLAKYPDHLAVPMECHR